MTYHNYVSKLSERMQGKFTRYIATLIPVSVPAMSAGGRMRDILFRLLSVGIMAGVFFILQKFEGNQRKLMRGILDSYKSSGLIAFKSVWDDLENMKENKNKIPRLKEYEQYAILIGGLIVFSLFKHLSIYLAIATGIVAGFLLYPLELHFILRWFYNNKSYPVEKHTFLNVLSLVLFTLFFLLSVITVGDAYYRYITRFPKIEYAAFALLVTGVVIILILVLTPFFRKNKANGVHLKNLRKFDLPMFLSFCFFPVMTVMLLAVNGKGVIQLAKPISVFLHNLFRLPEVLFPLLGIISLFLWTAANSYFGKPLERSAGLVMGKTDIGEDSDAEMEKNNPFAGEE